MALNKVEKGDSLDTVLTAITASGAVVELGDFVGVALAGGQIGDNVAVAYVGVFDLPKATTVGSGIAQGTKVYWDSVNHVITATAGALKVAGIVWYAALDADTTVSVRLQG
jgi:predicted RecA/RadA family phage recombinase